MYIFTASGGRAMLLAHQIPPNPIIPVSSGMAQNGPQLSPNSLPIPGEKGIFATSVGPQEAFTVAKIKILARNSSSQSLSAYHLATQRRVACRPRRISEETARNSSRTCRRQPAWRSPPFRRNPIARTPVKPRIHPRLPGDASRRVGCCALKCALVRACPDSFRA
jgi:hypothetical protein